MINTIKQILGRPMASEEELRNVLLLALNHLEKTEPERLFLRKNPLLAVDIIALSVERGHVALIERRNPPYGWALPGGFVDRGENLADAARREFEEETGAKLRATRFLTIRDEPNRDPRQHVVSVVFYGFIEGDLKAGDDAKNVQLFPMNDLPKLAFDHDQILNSYKVMARMGRLYPR